MCSALCNQQRRCGRSQRDQGQTRCATPRMSFAFGTCTRCAVFTVVRLCSALWLLTFTEHDNNTSTLTKFHSNPAAFDCENASMWVQVTSNVDNVQLLFAKCYVARQQDSMPWVGKCAGNIADPVARPHQTWTLRLSARPLSFYGYEWQHMEPLLDKQFANLGAPLCKVELLA